VRLSILNPLYDIVAWLIMRIESVLAVPLGADSGWTWALTIVVLVVLMRLLLLPLFIKQMHSQRKMLALAPQMKELRKRYKSDKQKLNEEMMKLYRENGANPLSGCLPLVAQLPVWYALLGVLEEITRWNPSQGKPQYGLTVKVVEDALHAKIFGVSIADTFLHTSSVHVKVVIAITVVCSSVTTFLTVRQSMKRGMMQTPTVDQDNPMAGAQKYMAYIAPLFALSGLYWQFGLVIYWVTTNVWTLGQQHFLFRNLPVVGANAESATAPAATAKGAAATKTAPAKSGAAKAGAARPGTSKPGAAKAGTAKPGTARPGTAKPGTAKPGTAKPGAAKPGTVRTGSAKTDAAANSATAAKRDGKSSASGKPAAAAGASAAKAGANGAAAGASAKDTQSGNGARNLLRFGKGKAEPEPEPVSETRVVRQQPVRQTRSKRSGKR
jgi:YidC/Oxa1 family membrane protein insertase